MELCVAKARSRPLVSNALESLTVRPALQRATQARITRATARQASLSVRPRDIGKAYGGSGLFLDEAFLRGVPESGLGPVAPNAPRLASRIDADTCGNPQTPHRRRPPKVQP